MPLNLPNLITWLRILMIPLLVGVYYVPHEWIADHNKNLVAAIIIGREIAISALREWMARIGRSKSVAVSFLGKIKTVSQMAAIILLLYHDEFLTLSMYAVGSILIYVAAVLTLWSMVYYLKIALPQAMKSG